MRRTIFLLAASPRSKTAPDGPTVADLCNHFLTFKKALLASDEIAARTFEEYYSGCERFVKSFGGTRMIADLTGDDFQRL